MRNSLITTIAIAMVLSVALPALAIPVQVPLQGVLRDNAGAPVSQGEFELTFTLYSDEGGETSVWTETRLVTVSGGIFRLSLGEVEALAPATVAASAGLWLGVQVETDPELPLRPLGSTPYAMVASNLACTGCITPEALSQSAVESIRGDILQTLATDGYATHAGELAIDGDSAGLAAQDVQSAVAELKALIDNQSSSTNVNEGAGAVRTYSNQWGLPSYGVAKDYVHIINPNPPKVQLYLYGGENTGFASSNNLIVSNTYTPNTYSGGANGTGGDDTMTVSNAGAFNQGDHILIHQTVGTDAGQWELNAVQSINGNSLKLAKPLERDYVSNSASGAGDMQRAQVVIAASYSTFEVVNGGEVYPSSYVSTSTENEFHGGVVYIRARQLTVKNGGSIHADRRGFDGGDGFNTWSNPNGTGDSSCTTNNYNDRNRNCSGGGGGGINCCSSSNCSGGGGGGGNATAGSTGNAYCGSYSGYQPGEGGAANDNVSGRDLHMGGGGGAAYWYGGRGGGLVILGAETLIVESGGRISANGGHGDGSGSYSGSGGGAGGTVAIFATTIDNQGTIEAAGGNAGDGYSNGDGGAGGDGFVHTLDPIPGIINQSYATGVEIWVDGQEITPVVGDPNAKGSPHWNAADEAWGATGTEAWSSGPLDLTNAANWTLGEHIVEFKETGGAGGDLKSYLYIIHPFSQSSPPDNDTCQTPLAIDLSEGPVVLSGTTEDVMGKTSATDASQTETCGGAGGADVVYKITLDERALINAALTAPFEARMYLRSAECAGGEVVYCAQDEMQTTPLEPGDYFLFVDSDTSTQKGNFALAVSLTPAALPNNNTCETAQALPIGQQGTATASGSNLYALNNYTSWCDPVGTGAEVLYTFNAGIGQGIEITLQNAEFDPIIYLFKGSCGGEAISCIYGDSLTISNQAGGEYWLVIDGQDEKAWGAFDLTVSLN